MSTHGASVRVYPHCRLHAKLLLTENLLVVRSTNWTQPSQRNVEHAAAMELADEAREAQVARFDALWSVGKSYDGRGAVPAGTPTRVRRSQTT